MVATLTSIYRGEESLPIQGICARYRGHPAARACWEQNNRSVAQTAEYFREGARAIGTFSGKHWAVRCRATALRSPYRHFRLAQRSRDVKQPVSYSPCSPVLHSSCITLAAQEELAVAQLRVAYMCVEVGDALFSYHHITSICNLFTHPQHLQRTQWTPGLPGLSFRASFLRHQASITSLLRLSATVTYVVIELYVLLLRRRDNGAGLFRFLVRSASVPRSERNSRVGAPVLT